MSKRFCLVALLALATSPVSAHVSLETKQATVGASYKAMFAVPHGCAGSPTVKIRVQNPRRCHRGEADAEGRLERRRRRGPVLERI
jgi:uncharacterized protein YcnI